MSYLFSPPNVADRSPIYTVWPDRYRPVPRLGQRLMSHYGPQTRGRSLLKIAGTYTLVDTPSQTQIDAATEVYLGGHVYEVSDTIAAALRAAGFILLAVPLVGEDLSPLLTESGNVIVIEGAAP